MVDQVTARLKSASYCVIACCRDCVKLYPRMHEVAVVARIRSSWLSTTLSVPHSTNVPTRPPSSPPPPAATGREADAAEAAESRTGTAPATAPAAPAP